MGRKDEKGKTKADNEAKEREKSKSYEKSDPFKVKPNRPGKESHKSKGKF